METNILVVVEGKKTEPQLLQRLSESFGLDFDIYCLESNIYTLYKELKAIDFNGNIKDILAELHPEQKEMQTKKFVYTYLIFDCDAHHPKRDDKRTIEEIVNANFKKLEEMSGYFVDETDPTVGRLYINFPMVESFKDCDFFFDPSYANNQVGIHDLTHYKEIVSKRLLSRIRMDQFTQKNWLSLILQNVYKLNCIETGIWDKPTYRAYTIESQLPSVIHTEKSIIDGNNSLAVLNMSLFIVLDYFGNRDGFYDQLIQ